MPRLVWVNGRVNRRVTLFGIAIALMLSGCEEAVQYLPSLPLSRQQQASTPAQSPTEMEEQIRQQINAIRQKQGLAPLSLNTKLAQVARSYSQRMAEQKFFSHTSPAGDNIEDRARAAGIFYFMIGENLFTSTNIPQPATAAVQGWMNSPGHRANILRPEYRETGIGVWQIGNTYYITQLFMRSL